EPRILLLRSRPAEVGSLQDGVAPAPRPPDRGLGDAGGPLLRREPRALRLGVAAVLLGEQRLRAGLDRRLHRVRSVRGRLPLGGAGAHGAVRGRPRRGGPGLDERAGERVMAPPPPRRDSGVSPGGADWQTKRSTALLLWLAGFNLILLNYTLIRQMTL